jgi:hypothetical protein
MNNPNQNLNSSTLSDLEKLIETIVQRVLTKAGIQLNQPEETTDNITPSYQDNLTPEERVKNWLDFVAGLPKTGANLPDEVLHRDNMYN